MHSCGECGYQSDEIYIGVGRNCLDSITVEPVPPDCNIEARISSLNPCDQYESEELLYYRALIDNRFFENGICPRCRCDLDGKVDTILFGNWD